MRFDKPGLRRYIHKMTRTIVGFAAGSLLLLSPAGAVHVIGTTGNTSAPLDDPGFANVGTLNGASAIYLGNRWVLTASHVGSGNVFFGGVPYAISGLATRLNNQGVSGMTVLTDMILFQIGADPGLPGLAISPGSPVLHDDLVMVGNGANRSASRSYYTAVQGPNPGDDIWTAAGAPGPGVEELFLPAPGSAVRWGTNNVESVGDVDVDAGAGTMRSFVTDFDDDAAGRPNEAQGVLGDSGSAVFRKVGGQWQLLGLTHAVDTRSGFDNIPGAPGSSVLDESLTFAADLSFYRGQILAIIPEPGSAVLAGAALLGLGCRRRR